MKNLYTASALFLAIGLFSCESDTDKRIKDLKAEGCGLTEAYERVLADPNDENATFSLIAAQISIKSGLKEEGITISKIQEAMKEECENANLFEEALNYD